MACQHQTILPILLRMRQAKLKHQICVRKGNVKRWGRETLCFKSYNKIEQILSHANSQGIVPQFIWWNSYGGGRWFIIYFQNSMCLKDEGVFISWSQKVRRESWQRSIYVGLPFAGLSHTARAPNLRHDLITAKVSCVIPKQSDWSIMMS